MDSGLCSHDVLIKYKFSRTDIFLTQIARKALDSKQSKSIVHSKGVLISRRPLPVSARTICFCDHVQCCEQYNTFGAKASSFSSYVEQSWYRKRVCDSCLLHSPILSLLVSLPRL